MRIAAARQTGLAHRPGITLIEVLLGLAIFLMAIVPIGKLVDMGTDHAVETSLQSEGTRLAQSKLAEVEAGVVPVATGGSGTFEDETEWSWTVTSTPASTPNLYSVAVTVSHDYRGRALTVSLSQMVVDPMVMGTGAPIAKPEEESTGGTAP